MSFHPSLPDRHHLSALWTRFPRAVEPLLELHDQLLRNSDSPLTIAERELIAAHVSAVNECHYCFIAHSRYARAFGIKDAVFNAMSVDTSHESLRPQMTAALSFAKKLTQAPAAIGESDYMSLIAAGWNEEGIHDIIFVTAVYAMMNRLLEGSGMKENVAPAGGFSAEKARAGRYTDMLAIIKGED